jgi:uncharacterized paraquat-inducible protein A
MDSVYVCSKCLYESPSYLASCPRCGESSVSKIEKGQPRICYKCDYETDRVLTECPECGQKLRTAGHIKVLGWVLLLLGAFLVVFMGAISFIVAGIISRTGQPGVTTSFNGGPKEAAMIFGIFGLVLAFGFTSMVAGFWQVWYGRRNKRLVFVMLGIAASLWVIAEVIEFLF